MLTNKISLTIRLFLDFFNEFNNYRFEIQPEDREVHVGQNVAFACMLVSILPSSSILLLLFKISKSSESYTHSLRISVG